MNISDSFDYGIDDRWHMTEIGTGQIIRRAGALHLAVNAIDDSQYADAQISDYDPVGREFSYQPPLRMQVTAYTSDSPDRLVGTAGFGFWNHPFAPNQGLFQIPQALWFFFGAPPNYMPLAAGQPPHGWKAATFNAKRWQFLSLLPLAPVAMPLMNIPPLYHHLWPIGQNAIGVREAALDAALLTQEHTYTLEWLPGKAIFYVDGDLVLHASHAIPRTPLGFIAWIDNQYAIVSPKGRIGWGFSPVVDTQSLVLRHISIESLA